MADTRWVVAWLAPALILGAIAALILSMPLDEHIPVPRERLVVQVLIIVVAAYLLFALWPKR